LSRALLTRKLSASLLLFVVCALSPPAAGAQEKGKKKAAPRGTPVLWRAPRNVERLDLLAGPGGAGGRPDLRRVTFVKEQEGGYSPKFRVRDARGREWVAKLGSEAQSETAAVRLLWAAGYMTEVNYLAPCVRIEGAPVPRKEVERCRGGGFANVRFEARPDGVERLDEWKWKENPFAGTRELQGLKIMMALFNNWDIKDSNNIVLYVPAGRRGRPGELRYAISDLGATFGKTGGLPLFWRITRSRNNPEDYEKSEFIEEVDDGKVDFKYGGKNRGLFDDVTVADARWLGGWLARLSDRQISDAFRAANYAPDEVRGLAAAVRRRVNELNRLPRAGREARRR
jgi:hypothetical protein